MRLLLTAALLLAACSDTSISSVDHDPDVVIVRPADGADFDPLAPVALCMQISDEDPLDLLELTVESGTDGVLYQGMADTGECTGGNTGLDLDLSDASHLLSVTVTDTRGQPATTTTHVQPIANTPPRCELLSPEDGSVWEVGELIPFEATAADDESDPSQLEASVAVDGEPLWDGHPDSSGDLTFSDDSLEEGDREVVLTLTDPRGLTDACVVHIYVDPCLDQDLDGYTTCEGDCDDSRDDVYPGAGEKADGRDNDCDGEIDEGTALGDDDHDGWAEADGDCDDTDPQA